MARDPMLDAWWCRRSLEASNRGVVLIPPQTPRYCSIPDEDSRRSYVGEVDGWVTIEVASYRGITPASFADAQARVAAHARHTDRKSTRLTPVTFLYFR